MNTVGELALVAVVFASASSFGWWLAAVIKADGYGFRATSGLPRDWSPAELPSTPYALKPHH